MSQLTLNSKQKAFVEFYLTLWNATEAARRAGYSDKTANEQASRLLANVSVQQAVSNRLSELKATADEVLVRLTSHARGSMDDFVTGDSIDLDKARKRGAMHLIKRFKVTTTTITDDNGNGVETHRTEIELYDAQAATVQIGKALGVFVEPSPVTVNIQPLRIERLDYRVALAALAPGSVGDLPAPGEDEVFGDGPPLG